MGSPVSYFDYMSPVPYCLLFISLMFSMIVMLMSGSSVIHWLHANRHWTQEQLKQGNYFVLSYLFVDSHAYILCRFVILKQRAKPLFDTIQRQCEACGEITGRNSHAAGGLEEDKFDLLANRSSKGTRNQFNSDTFWTGQHLIVQYWSGVATTSSVVMHAGLNYKQQCRVPQFLARGPFNDWGYDQDISSAMNLVSDGTWEHEIMAAWPTYLQLNVFGYDDYYYSDVDGDGIMDRLPPNSIAHNYLNLSAPPYPALTWALIVDDATLEWTLEPRGHASHCKDYRAVDAGNSRSTAYLYHHHRNLQHGPRLHPIVIPH
ncbi:uncharacterized protein F5891DRAFT_1247697 [Suillus fuscotomentosus]|uniref:Uncharacterized protein n=1 Tax=Suillus fuscotomentosus TaxID=1912939 RepID=A0AAD4DY33_9AGAM|nr:uncharacterized protein F5891DRAFT_1247697 [Suillus fuscotomentosus]KAG1896229.1 hypothetical protein F5891DRAFT_1247697 [Suillus fuscotomentosus]